MLNSEGQGRIDASRQEAGQSTDDAACEAGYFAATPVDVQGLFQQAVTGNVAAQWELAEWWNRTVGFAAAAFPWYMKVARAGSGPAAYEVAYMYLSGKGIEESPELAMHWGLVAIGRGERAAVGIVNEARAVLTVEERVQILIRYREQYLPG